MHCSCGQNKIFGAIIWLLTALGAIHLGLMGIGYNIWESPFIQHNHMLRQAIIPIHWAIGIAGAISLFTCVQWLATGGCRCHEGKR